MTIKGAVWMQGEANSRGDGRQYNCSFRESRAMLG